MKRKVLIATMILIFLGIFVSGYVWYTMQQSLDRTRSSLTVKTEDVENDNMEYKDPVSILLVGADQRPGVEKYNTDSIIMATIDPSGPRISLLSIPRDTRVSIPGHPNIKINSVTPISDIQKLQEVVSEFTGVPIAGYVQTNFEGFKQIIDTLGGVTIDVEKNMYYETGDIKDGYINLKKGVQRLDGSKALQYARFRQDALADISRTARQQVVLKAVAKEMMQLSTLPKLPWLVPQLLKVVHTNVPFGDLLKISKAAVQFKNAEVITQTLPGKFYELNGTSFWEIDSKEAKGVVNDLLRGITTSKVIEEQEVDLLKPIVVTPQKPLPVVPGNPADPNGQKSSGYQEVEVLWPLGPDGGA
jgi:polyisoprenyl-teichoic acid--peptidoglycan teichoic acid transferase